MPKTHPDICACAACAMAERMFKRLPDHERERRNMERVAQIATDELKRALEGKEFNDSTREKLRRFLSGFRSDGHRELARRDRTTYRHRVPE